MTALKRVFCNILAAKYMNLSRDPMSAARVTHHGKSYIASAYCKTPVRFVGHVIPENYAPIITQATYQIDVPFNTTAQSVSCYNVTNITEEVVTDNDGKFKGLAIIQAKDSSYGSWMYKCSELESFQKLAVPTNLVDLENYAGNLSCILLNPSCW